MLVLSDRVRETPSVAASLLQFNALVDRRLAVAGRGLAELRQHLASGQTADAQTLVEKLDEDLHLLRCRLNREVESAAPRAAVLYGSATALGQAN